MQDYVFSDALTGSIIELDPDAGNISLIEGVNESHIHESIFFPGCSMINYALPLVQAVFSTLELHGIVGGMSLLCCGKILSYEPDGQELRAEFEEDLRKHAVQTGVKRIVCACPNCVLALRNAFAADDATKDIQIDVLPEVLADLGYTIDIEVANKLMGVEGRDVLLCPHDSCPDRQTGEFARGMRRLMPDAIWKDSDHCYAKSICCGSLPRAAGKIEAADACALRNGQDAEEVGADALVTACMSCAFQLNTAQDVRHAVHVLELLYDWRINWAYAAQFMKIRFLFNETMGAMKKEEIARQFVALDESATEGELTVSDIAVEEMPMDDADSIAGHEATISNEDVLEIKE